jgi:hypothetical protein
VRADSPPLAGLLVLDRTRVLAAGLLGDPAARIDERLAQGALAAP